MSESDIAIAQTKLRLDEVGVQLVRSSSSAGLLWYTLRFNPMVSPDKQNRER